MSGKATGPRNTCYILNEAKETYFITSFLALQYWLQLLGTMCFLIKEII